jgi:hypothetical protein
MSGIRQTLFRGLIDFAGAGRALFGALGIPAQIFQAIDPDQGAWAFNPCKGR